LIIETEARIFLIGGRGDAKLCAQIAETVGDQCTNTAGQLTLRQSAALLDRCQILISNDSAPTHLGVATRCKVITIFGPTVPAFGFAPFGQGHVVIEKNLSCRPCSAHGSHRCPIGTHACMNEISVDAICAHVLSLRRMTTPHSKLVA
ncbi:MAG: glycosyltransferase family 9 protein, partial [candidate division KSB1 bacterium]|nr:glycosyltransferase family 9 protein [candidate division KSB1 bacterium]